PSSKPRHPPTPTLFPYTTLFRSGLRGGHTGGVRVGELEGERDRTAVVLLGGDEPPRCQPREAVRGRGEAGLAAGPEPREADRDADRKSTRLNSSHVSISYAVFCL